MSETANLFFDSHETLLDLSAMKPAVSKAPGRNAGRVY
jgi:hypothetical protein